MDKEMETMMRSGRRGRGATKKGYGGRGAKGAGKDERKRRKMAGGGGRLDEEDENDRGKDGEKEIML
jgi:hypothetical protein